MAKSTPNLDLVMDAGGKVGLDQMVTDNFKKISVALGINIPVRTEGMSALKQSVVSGMVMIGTALGKRSWLIRTELSGLSKVSSKTGGLSMGL
jgi:hypothetical protein